MARKASEIDLDELDEGTRKAIEHHFINRKTPFPITSDELKTLEDAVQIMWRIANSNEYNNVSLWVREAQYATHPYVTLMGTGFDLWRDDLDIDPMQTDIDDGEWFPIAFEIDPFPEYVH